MRNDAHRVCFADGGDFHQLGDPAHVWQRRADEVDVMALDEPVEVPPEAPFFAMRQRHHRHLAQLREVLKRVLVADRIFNEEWLVLFDRPAQTHRVIQVEPLVKIDAPVSIRADAFTRFFALLSDLPDDRTRVVDAADRRIGGGDAKCTVSFLHRPPGALFETRPCTC